MRKKSNITPGIQAIIFRACVFILTIATGQALAQEEIEKPFTPIIRGAIAMENSHVPHATEGGKKVSIIPGWGIDIDYYFHQRWSVACQGDIKLQSFEIENEGVALERTYPIAMAAVLHYHTRRHWSFYAGPGIELERHENFFMIKTGTEYSFEITENFEIALNFIYENKEEVYDTLTFAIAFNKKLWSKSK